MGKLGKFFQGMGFSFLFKVILVLVLGLDLFGISNTITYQVETNSTIDLSKIQDTLEYNTTIKNDIAKFHINLKDYFANISYCGAKSSYVMELPDDLSLDVKITKDGIITINTVSSDASSHLAVLVGDFSQYNYQDFNNQNLDKSIYNTPKFWANADIIHNNLLGLIAQRVIYQKLYKAGAITNGVENSYKFYNFPTTLTNGFSKDITIIKSFLSHQQKDYSWYKETQWPIDELRNALWSPIANNKDQDTNITRSFDISMSKDKSLIFIKSSTDNNMNASVTLYDLQKERDYSKSAEAESWRKGYLKCDKDNKTCQVSNSNCAGASLFLKDEYPSKVEMKIHTTWSSSHDVVSIATFGDINVSNFSETPQNGDDNNPKPLKFVLKANINDSSNISNNNFKVSKELSIKGEGFYIADIDNDGKNELIVGDVDSKSVKIYSFNGNNFELKSEKTFSATPRSIIVADPDSDGVDEILVGTGDGDNGGYVYVLDYDNGNFNEEWKSPKINTIRWGKELAVGDINNDGKKEIIVGVSYYGRYLVSYEYNGNSYNQIFSDSIGSDVNNVTVSDIDNDGKDELLIGTLCWSHYGIKIYKNDYATVLNSSMGGMSDIDAIDLDGDGNKELIVGRGTKCGGSSTPTTVGRVYKYENGNITKLFETDELTSNNDARTHIATGNFNNKPIFAYATYNSGSSHENNYLKVFNADYKEIFSYKYNETAQKIQIADIDNDGSNEILLKLYSKLIVFKNSFKNTIELFSEDFSNGLLNWIQFGDPSPKVIDSVKGKDYVFDNNGDPNYDSGAYSIQKITIKEGSVIEADIYVDFSDLSGCWAGDTIYISENENPQTSSTKAPRSILGWWLQAEGDACWATDAKYRKHAWFSFKVLTEDGSYESPTRFSISADDYVNGWHKTKIKIRDDKKVEFYIDNTLLWTSTKKVDISKLVNKRLVLGNRSSGSAGKAYIDDVKVYNQNGSGSDTTHPLVKKTIPIQKGWNLIALPESFSLDNDDMQLLWTNDGSSAFGGWRVYSSVQDLKNTIASKNIPLINAINSNRGYWYLSNKDKNLSIEDKNVTFDNTILKSGWNLVGTNANISTKDIKCPDSYQAISLWKFKNKTWELNTKIPNNYYYKSFNTIFANEGFWVYCQ